MIPLVLKQVILESAPVLAHLMMTRKRRCLKVLLILETLNFVEVGGSAGVTAASSPGQNGPHRVVGVPAPPRRPDAV